MDNTFESIEDFHNRDEFRVDPYNQYTQLDKLPKLLKRFSFSEKVRVCYEWSIKAIKFSKEKDFDKLKQTPLPWTVETFFLLSIAATEYKEDSFDSPQNQKKLYDMINAIWSSTGEICRNRGNEFASYFIPVTALTQFQLQEVETLTNYRYWYIFTHKDENANLDMAEVFKQFFGTDYFDFLLLSYLLKVVLIAAGTNMPRGIYEYILKKFTVASKQLTIQRNEYIAELKKMVSEADDPLDYIYCVRPSYKYAFIEFEDKLFFPLPHLLHRNTTSSLLYRLTDPNTQEGNALRSNIGKNVLEPYLYFIVQGANVYDEVYPEVTYGKNCERSPDVMARCGQDILFLEMKASVPRSNIRLLDEGAFAMARNALADNIVQLYKQIRKFPHKYNPFRPGISIDKQCVWGVVVVLEDPYIRRQEIYPVVYEKLNISKSSTEATWINEHIKVVELYQIERQCFCSNNIIVAIKENNNEGNLNGYEFRNRKTKITNAEVIAFNDKLDAAFDGIIQELKDMGVLTN